MDKINIFYRSEQSSDAATGISPSAGKPARALADWTAHPQIAPFIAVQSFEPVSRDILYAAHSWEYVDDVLDGMIENGFGNYSEEIAMSLPYTVGSMLAAAQSVVGRPWACAVSPTSGFHHAGYSNGRGFCTFNGLMATAIEMHRSGHAKRILIVDMDNHYGDGTEDIIRTLGIDFVDHITSNKSYETADEALKACRSIEDLELKQYDLVLYQAGADIHRDDPLGGLMSTEQMRKRDQLIFHGCYMRRLPIAWNLAGGYQRDAEGTIEPVLSLHRTTMLECIAQYAKNPDR